MKKISYTMILIIVMLLAGCSGETDESIAQNKVQKVDKVNVENVASKNFVLTFNQGLEKAKKEKKNMLIDFYTDWCHWCKVMDEKTFSEKAVAEKLSNRFVTVRIDAEANTGSNSFKGHTFNNMEMTRAFGVTGFPSLIFISPEEEVITKIPGYVPAEQFAYILDYIDQECYKKQMSLEEFMKKKGECDDTTEKPKSDNM
ncbi:MAG: thioredoxin family protein [Candidatus Zhuqueibacterota bacterium]